MMFRDQMLVGDLMWSDLNRTPYITASVGGNAL